MTSAAGEKSPSRGTFTVVGTRPLRHDGVDKVTGHARYGADVHMPGLLHGKVLRSPHAHARIRSIDTSQAEALPGVPCRSMCATTASTRRGAVGSKTAADVARNHVN